MYSHVNIDAYCFERNQFMLQLCVCRDIEHLGSFGEHERGVRVARGAHTHVDA